MAGNPTARILHLTDLGFPPKLAWKQDPVASGLVHAAGSWQDVDLVAVTGDVAADGSQAAFQAAEAWLRALLDALGLPEDRLCLVAGERDLDGGPLSVTADGTMTAMLDRGQAGIAEVWQDAAQHSSLTARLDNWLEFANRLRGHRPPLETPWWHEVHRVNGTDVAVLGLCSAWTARGGRTDQGALVVGEAQVNALTLPYRRHPAVVALLHHPHAWLHWKDAAAWKTLQRRAHLLLGGHPPRDRVVRVEVEAHAQVEVCYGASLGAAGDQPRCALVELCGPGRVEVRPYVFEAHQDAWVPDRTAANDTHGVVRKGGAPVAPARRAKAPGPKPALPAAPYPVLAPYTHPDTLGGRAQHLAQLTELLQGDRLVLSLHAASGAGKSSLLRAGLMPWLHGWTGRSWDPAAYSDTPARPGLAQRLASQLIADPVAIDDDEAAGFAALLAQVRDDRGSAPVLVLDQFEDAFKGDRRALAWLGPMVAASAVAPQGRAATWVLAYRHEFAGRVAGWLADLLRYAEPGRCEGLPTGLGTHDVATWRVPLLGDPEPGHSRQAAASAAFLDAIQAPLRLQRADGRPRYAVQIDLADATRLADAFARARHEDRDAPLTPELQVVLDRLIEEADGQPLRVPPDPGAVDELVDQAIRHHLADRLDRVAGRTAEGEPAQRRTAALLLLARLVDEEGRRRAVERQTLEAELEAEGRELLVALEAPGVWLVRADEQGRLQLPHDRVAAEVHRILNTPDEIVRYQLDGELVDLWRLVAQRAAAWPGDPDADRVDPERMALLLSREAALPRSPQVRRWWTAAQARHSDWLRQQAEERVRGKTPQSGEPLRALHLLQTEHGYDGARLAAVLSCDDDDDEAFKFEKRDEIFGIGPMGLDPDERSALLPALIEALAPQLEGAVEAESFWGALLASADVVCRHDPGAGHRAIQAVVQAMRAARGQPPPLDQVDWSPEIAGEFRVGAFPGDPGALDGERLHRVELSPYRMARHAVGLGDYRRFCRDHLRAQRWPDDWPAIQVNWYQARAFAAWRGATLPTEHQWEVACRGGHADYRQDAWFCGKDEADLERCGFHSGLQARLFAALGQRPLGVSEPLPFGDNIAHPLGLVHVHGNVGEWCQDWFAPYDDDTEQDPAGPAVPDSPSARRVIRGGSWVDPARFARSACRSWYRPAVRDVSVGFRLVLPSRVGGGT